MRGQGVNIDDDSQFQNDQNVEKKKKERKKKKKKKEKKKEEQSVIDRGYDEVGSRGKNVQILNFRGYFEAVRGRGGQNRGHIRGQVVNIGDVTKFQSDRLSREPKV